MKKFFITTAIDYANGTPHIGHAYEKVLTDVVARFRRKMGDEVYFLTGLDEHGQKVQQSARTKGIEPQELCDQAAGEFQGLCRDLLISNDDYIRTTEDRHKTVVRTLLQMLFDEGQIYKADYQGYYSPRQEQFLQEKDKVDGKWPAIFGEVIELTESNYFFKLKQYQDWLIDYLKAHPEFVVPAFRLKDVLSFLKEPLNDLCISRPRDRLEWGIPLPFDEEYVTYVWFDALINYVSGAGFGTPEFEKNWPADFHVIGKDILVPPHAIYWPIMLHACGIELPKALLVHGWWMTSGQKMSKSSGEVVNPLDLVGQFGADSFRYFVMREMSVGQDSDFSVELFMSRYNSDLANDLGNLVNRTLNMTNRFRDAVVPAAGADESFESELKTLWESSREESLRLNAEFQFHMGLDRAFTFIRAINRYAEQRAPWKLGKSEDSADQQALSTTLATMAESLRLAVTLVEPVMPETADKVRALLGATVSGTWHEQLRWGDRLAGAKVGETAILFPRPEKA
jgi:methionyl-tRNA synthetase